MRSILLSLAILVLAMFSFAGSCPSGEGTCFLCGGVDGIACDSDCPGGPIREGLGAVACECPQGEPCVCYCPYGGGGPEVKDEESLIESAEACPSLPCGNDCAIVEGIGGKVGVKIDGSWCLAKAGTIIPGGSKVWVLDRSSLSLRYADGGKMDVRENSVFRIAHLETIEDGATTRLVIDMAEGAFRHLTETDRKEQFEIETNSICTTPKGTEFVIETDGESTSLKVLDGSVEFFAYGSDTHVLVEEGMSSTITSGSSAPSPPSLFDVEDEPRWWDGGGSCLGATILILLLGFIFLSGGRE